MDKEKNDKNAKVIFINGWYRNLLGIPRKDTKESADPVNMNVSIVENSFLNFLAVGLYRYPFNHPQNLVRLTAMLTIIGLGLGLVGFGLGLLGLVGPFEKETKGDSYQKGLLYWACYDIGLVFFSLGIGMTASGPIYSAIVFIRQR